MSTLSDLIEEYLRNLLINDQEGIVELQRRKLAAFFHCAPSQINYVLETRFTTQQGYLVQSRRGGGGYIRIQKVMLPREDIRDCHARIGDEVSEREADQIIQNLKVQGIIPSEAASLIRSMLKEILSFSNQDEAGKVRAILLKNLLYLVCIITNKTR